jgi:GNAT superfamily N-acetyltransferase
MLNVDGTPSRAGSCPVAGVDPMAGRPEIEVHPPLVVVMPKFAEALLTYLEMRHRPESVRSLPPGVRVYRLDAPTVDQYRFLYNDVGAKWHWADRRLLPDAELEREIAHPLVDILLLEVEGVAAGYAELDRRRPSEVQIVYFGLRPGFIGRGLGRAFLDAVVSHAWDCGPERVWLHTCSLDHPGAIPLYRSAGFEQYRTETRSQRLLDADV